MNKKVLVLILAVLTLVASIGFSEDVVSNQRNLKIGFVNVKKVMNNYFKWTELNDKYKNDFEYYQTKINDMQKEFQDLKESGATEEQLGQKYQEIQYRANQYQQELQTTFQQKSDDLLKEITNFIGAKAEEMKYDLIISEVSVVYVGDYIDITDDIIKLLPKE